MYGHPVTLHHSRTSYTQQQNVRSTKKNSTQLPKTMYNYIDRLPDSHVYYILQ